MTADPPYLPDLRGEARNAAIRALSCEVCGDPADPDLSIIPASGRFLPDYIRCRSCGLDDMLPEDRDFHD